MIVPIRLVIDCNIKHAITICTCELDSAVMKHDEMINNHIRKIEYQFVGDN